MKLAFRTPGAPSFHASVRLGSQFIKTRLPENSSRRIAFDLLRSIPRFIWKQSETVGYDVTTDWNVSLEARMNYSGT